MEDKIEVFAMIIVGGYATLHKIVANHSCLSLYS